MRREFYVPILLRLIADGLLFRLPMRVTDIRRYLDGMLGWVDYPICPRCGKAIEYEYQAFCSFCGQALEWSEFEDKELDECE